MIVFILPYGSPRRRSAFASCSALIHRYYFHDATGGRFEDSYTR